MAPRRAAAAAATQSMAQANQAPQAGPSGGAEAKKVGRTKAAAGAGLAISATLPTRQDPPVSPIIAKLRRSWQFAAVCQFLFTFDEAFGMSGFETEVSSRAPPPNCSYLLASPDHHSLHLTPQLPSDPMTSLRRRWRGTSMVQNRACSPIWFAACCTRSRWIGTSSECRPLSFNASG